MKIKTKKKDKATQAIIIAGILVSSLTVVISLGLIKTYQPEPRPPAEQPPVENVTDDQAGTVAQQYVIKAASYDLEQSPPIILKKIHAVAENSWNVLFEVAQQDQSETQIYNYTVEVVEGRVTGHTVSVMDHFRRILLSSPEPEQIISGSELTVKGKVYPKQGDDFSDVRIKLYMQDLPLAQLLRSAPINEANDYSFVVSFNLPENFNGEARLDCSAGAYSVGVPVIISQKP